jgi:HEAT repeat protein
VPGSKEAFDRKLAALESLRADPGSLATLDALRKALKDRNNFLVAKAATLCEQLSLKALKPDLATAFERFMIDPVKSDPKCWAKNALAKALKDLEHDDPAVFLRGIVHIQREPVWGGQSDSAVTLRGICALALVATTLDRVSILMQLVDMLADPEKPARIDAIRALGQFPGHDTVHLLRLNTLLAGMDPEVAGNCFDALLSIDPAESVPFVARFLSALDPDVRAEAAAALGSSPEPLALYLLQRTFEDRIDPELKAAILRSLAASRQAPAADFLLTVIEEARPELAATALESLAAGRFREEFHAPAAEAVRHRNLGELTAAFHRYFSPSPIPTEPPNQTGPRQ